MRGPLRHSNTPRLSEAAGKLKCTSAGAADVNRTARGSRLPSNLQTHGNERNRASGGAF